MDNEIKCPFCGSADVKKRFDGKMFCRDCGETLDACAQCGSFDIGKAKNGTRFCRDCGAKGDELIIAAKPTETGKEPAPERANAEDAEKKSPKETIGAFSAFAATAAAGIQKSYKGLMVSARNDAENPDKQQDTKGKKETEEPDPVKKTGYNEAKESFDSDTPEEIIGEIGSAPDHTVKEHPAVLPAKPGKDKLKKIAIAAAIALVAVILTLVLVKSNCSLVNEWKFGANTYTFNDDGTFTANVNTMNNSGTYTVSGSNIHLKYSFMGILEKETDLTYAISGKTLTLTGDVSLTGAGSVSLDYECTSGSGNGWLKALLVIAEIVAAGLCIFCIILPDRKKKAPAGSEKTAPSKPDTDHTGGKNVGKILLICLLLLLVAGGIVFGIIRLTESKSASGGKSAKKPDQQTAGSTEPASDEPPEITPDAKVGDYVGFGKYEQDNNTENGKEPIEWLVLFKEGSKALLISKKALDCQPFNTEYVSTTWENSSLRVWLNDTFYHSAFTDSDKGRIISSVVSADKNPKYTTDPGNAVRDNIFLLSIDEASQYFSGVTAKNCAPTAYAKAHGTRVNEENKTEDGEDCCLWWLRTPGKNTQLTAGVMSDGTVDYAGHDILDDTYAVRPALWINLNGELSSVSVRTMPAKTSYTVGEILNTNGMELELKYKNGAAETVTSGFTCSPTLLNTAGTQEITVTCNGKTTKFEVVVQKPLSASEVGDYIMFGKYEQDNNTGNGKEDIEWLVLAKDGNKALVISKYALDCQRYNTSSTDITWETCTLRTWLNGTFYNSAFSDAEKARIQTTSVVNDDNSSYGTDGGRNTTDKVFLLSITEAEKYFSGGGARRCAPTAYAKAHGARTNSNYKTASGEAACLWWLRSPGYDQNYAAHVNVVGSVYYSGDHVGRAYDAVRPALWINLDS